MIRSMTGYGRGENQVGDYQVRAEIRSVNNRNLRVSSRLPDRLQGLDPEIDRILRGRLSRGTVTLSLQFDDFSGDPGYVIDEAVVAHYKGKLSALADSLGMEEGITLDKLISMPGAVRRNVGAGEICEDLKAAALLSADAALASLVENREQEGENIWRDIMDRCARISGIVDDVEKKLPGIVASYRTRVMERLKPLLEEVGAQLSEDDVRKEVVFFADRTDIAEEITRMRSHIGLMGDLTEQADPSGRRAEFIAQEMFREANTMGSKAGDAEMIPDLLEIKAEVEKIREQALNVE
jgi:uncharacterized protein (TIGR00255 family)